MKKIYVLIEDKNLQAVLCNILEILGFLPIIVDKYQKTFLKDKQEHFVKVIFTDYYNIKMKNTILNNFQELVIITSISESFLPIEYNTKKVTYFSKSPTITNLKYVLKKVKLLI